MYYAFDLDMLYNPTTGQVGHIQPIRYKKTKENDMDIWGIMEKELIQYRALTSSLRIHTMYYEDRCHLLISKIKTSIFEESQELFDELFAMQSYMSTALYKYSHKLSDKLQSFVYCFERQSDFMRKKWYEDFKNGLEWPEY